MFPPAQGGPPRSQTGPGRCSVECDRGGRGACRRGYPPAPSSAGRTRSPGRSSEPGALHVQITSSQT